MVSVVDKAKAETPRQIRQLQEQLAQSKRDAAQLQQIVDQQSERLAQKAGQLFKSPKSLPNVKTSHFHRVLIPDSHGAHIDKRAASALLSDLERLAPREVVWLGDHLDCGGFLAQHHAIGFIAEMSYSYADDIEAGNQFVDEVQKRTPNAVHHWLTGNHEHRVQRWCIQQAVGNSKDAHRLMLHNSVEHVLELERRGIHYYPRDFRPRNSRAQGAIRLGACNFVHDVSTSRHPARDAVNKWAANIMFGDTHRIDIAYSHKGGRDCVGATFGHISHNRRYWQETNLTDWMHGYGLQIVHSNEDFLTLAVPIVNGKSLLGPLLGRVK